MCKKKKPKKQKKAPSITLWKTFLHLLALWQCYLDFNDLGGERWRVKSRRGTGQSWPGHHHLSPPPFLCSFTSWHGKWHSQSVSLKKPFLSSQTLPVLTEWESERVRGEEKKWGRKRADRGIFQHGFSSISVRLSKREAAPGCWAGWKVVRQGLNFECGQSGEDELLNSFSMSM